MKAGDKRVVEVVQHHSWPSVMGGMVSYSHKDATGVEHDSCYGLPLYDQFDELRDGTVFRVTIEVVKVGKKIGTNPWRRRK